MRKHDDSTISVYQYEQARYDLDLAKSNLVQTSTQLAIAIAQKDALFSHLVDLKNSMAFVLSQVDKFAEKTEKEMNSKMQTLEDKVNRVQEVIKDTLQFSNRTYFMEEVRNM